MSDIELMFSAGVTIFIFGIISGYAPSIRIDKRK